LPVASLQSTYWSQAVRVSVESLKRDAHKHPMTEIAARSENIFSLFSSKLNHFAIFGMNCATGNDTGKLFT